MTNNKDDFADIHDKNIIDNQPDAGTREGKTNKIDFRNLTVTQSIVIAFVILNILPVVFGSMSHFELYYYLLAGWLVFLSDRLSRILVDWGHIAFACSIFVFFTALGWRIIGRLPLVQDFRKRLTISLAIPLVLMVGFAVGTSMIGIFHQVGWALTSSSPWWVNPVYYRPSTRNTLKQIGIAAHNYLSHEQVMLPGVVQNEIGNNLWSWETALLPYIEHNHVYDCIDFCHPWDSKENREVFSQEIDPLKNRGLLLGGRGSYGKDPITGYALSHFSASSRVLGYGRSLILDEISDGTSCTLLLGEISRNFTPWGKPGNLRDPALGLNNFRSGFGGVYEGGAHFLFCDGSSRFVSNNIDAGLLRALSTPNAGDEVTEF